MAQSSVRDNLLGELRSFLQEHHLNAGQLTQMLAEVGDVTSSDAAAAVNSRQTSMETEYFANATLDALSSQIAILDADGTIVAVNKAWRETSGQIGLNLAVEGSNYLQMCEAVTGGEAPTAIAFAAGVRTVIEGSQHEFMFEYPFNHQDEKHWFVSKVTRFSSNGLPRVVIVHENVTEQMQVEHELSLLYEATSYLFKSDSLLNLGYQIAHAVVKQFDHDDCTLVIFNRKQKTAIGVTHDGQFFTQDEDNYLREQPPEIQNALKSGKLVYHINPDQNPQGAQASSHIIVTLRGTHEIVGALFIKDEQLYTLQARHQRALMAFAERAASAIETMLLYEELNHYASELEVRVARRTSELHRAKERVEAILNNSGDAIILARAEGAIQQVNPRFREMMGYISDEVFGTSLATVFDPEQLATVEAALQEVGRGDQPVRIELAARRKDGSTFVADVTVAPIIHQDTRELNVICSIRDITHHRRLEEELRRSIEKERELSELKTRFVSMVSHEFRTPLATILSSTDLIRSYWDRMAPERKELHFDKIHTQIKRLTSMLDDVLTLSRAEMIGVRFNPTVQDIVQFCYDIVDDMHMIDDKHKLTFASNGQFKLIPFDTLLMRQAITNLLSNAIKYSPEGKPIRLDMHCDPEAITIKVKDEGIGIPAEDLPHLFEVFHRATNVGTVSGTGLGLVIVKSAIEAHGGQISVESHVNQGTTFTITFPLSETKEA